MTESVIANLQVQHSHSIGFFTLQSVFSYLMERPGECVAQRRKLGKRQRFHERFCNLLSRRNVRGIDDACSLCIFGRMVVDVDVLCPLVHFGVVYESNAGLIIRKEWGGVCRGVANFGEEIAKPYDLSCGCPGNNIFHFGGAGCGNTLLLRTPHNWATIKKDDILGP